MFTLWWQVDMKMSVRVRSRRRVGKGEEMRKEEKNGFHPGHPVRDR